MERIIFIDVDGTLCDVDGTVPQSAITAIQTARKNGHKIFICTGRAKSEVYPSIFAIGFDGMVGSAGAYVECGDEVVFHKSIEEEALKELIGYLEENNIAFLLETTKGVYLKKEDKEELEKIFKRSNMAKNGAAEEFVSLMHAVENIHDIKNVNKVLYFRAPLDIEIMQERLKEHFLILPNSIGGFGENSGEISDKNINKSTGIQKVLGYYGKTKESVIALGDGANDVEMLKFAEVGIAMGNAWDYLKEYADEVTDSVKDNGIYNSFKKHGLI
ncbi:HAD family hydrolase [Konateibacter massiliensis]|uniref:HAD family hydrolase n=1 Tax=Konateibacter massiliensis TaxID=2002841 RepID=UPI0015D49BB0|nr:HAD family hydrolase [Konateibacter massiliensis]